MKNLHLLPKSEQKYQVKEGGLFINDTRKHSWGKLEVLKCERITVNGHAWNGTGIKTDICHLYITSDEKPNVDEYYLGEDSNIYCLVTTINFNGKKIILTTDPDLIANGVKAIDDKFLEWFAKNSSCEYVEVEKLLSREIRDINWIPFYRIIIPQEEPKQETLEENSQDTAIRFLEWYRRKNVFFQFHHYHIPDPNDECWEQTVFRGDNSYLTARQLFVIFKKETYE